MNYGPNSPLRALDKPKRRHTHVEAPIQRAVCELYAACGMSVYVNSVYGGQPHGVTPGIPDLRIKEPSWRLDLDFETKAPKRRQSRAQYDYLRECQAMGTVYVLGGLNEAMDFLVWLGIATRIGDEKIQFIFIPRERWASVVETGGPPWLFAAGWYMSPQFLAAFDRYGYKP